MTAVAVAGSLTAVAVAGAMTAVAVAGSLTAVAVAGSLTAVAVAGSVTAVVDPQALNTHKHTNTAIRQTLHIRIERPSLPNNIMPTKNIYAAV
jgi:hypothetical protein